jgi:hypothetical protein
MCGGGQEYPVANFTSVETGITFTHLISTDYIRRLTSNYHAKQFFFISTNEYLAIVRTVTENRKCIVVQW